MQLNMSLYLEFKFHVDSHVHIDMLRHSVPYSLFKTH